MIGGAERSSSTGAALAGISERWRGTPIASCARAAGVGRRAGEAMPATRESLRRATSTRPAQPIGGAREYGRMGSLGAGLSTDCPRCRCRGPAAYSMAHARSGGRRRDGALWRPRRRDADRATADAPAPPRSRARRRLGHILPLDPQGSFAGSGWPIASATGRGASTHDSPRPRDRRPPPQDRRLELAAYRSGCAI